MSALDEPTLREIFLIYDRIVGGKRIAEYLGKHADPNIDFALDWIKSELRETNAAGLRLGSKLNGGEGNAKFYAWDEGSCGEGDRAIRFSFDPNLVRTPQGDSMKAAFGEAVDWYLFSKGIAVFLRWNNEYRKFFEMLDAKIQEEFENSANSWVACARSVIFQTETELRFGGLKGFEEDQREFLKQGMERVKEMGFVLGGRYPDKESVPSQEERDELIGAIAIIRLLMESR